MENIYLKLKNSKASGIKLLGAGGGGFLLSYCEKKIKIFFLRKMRKYKIYNFKFDEVGVKNYTTMNKKEFEKTIKFVNFLTKKKYTYNFKWLGIDAIQFPSDLIVIQELIYKLKPNVIIETGVAKGGSLIFYSSILNLINQKYKKVIGIDILIKKKIK